MTSKDEFYIKHYMLFERLELDNRKKKMIDAIKESGPNKEFENLLDIGCGDGTFSLYLQNICRSNHVYGIEISSEGCDLARKNGIAAFQLDIDKDDLPFSDEYFDIIVCGEVIEHLFDPDHLLDEINRTLKKGGIAIISTPNLSCWYNRIVLLFGYQPFWTSVSLRYNLKMIEGGYANKKGGEGHIRLFTYDALKKLLMLHNFKTIGIGVHMSHYFPFPINFIEKIMSIHKSFASDIIFRLEKRDRNDDTNI